MTDREALAAALETVSNPALNWREPIYQAARERIAQLPPYDDALVERIARVLNEIVHEALAKGGVQLSDKSKWTTAVLDSLNETP